MTEADHRILQAADLPRPRRLELAAELGMTSPALHQRLVALLETREALEAYPVVVNRQRRLQAIRRRARGSRP